MNAQQVHSAAVIPGLSPMPPFEGNRLAEGADSRGSGKDFHSMAVIGRYLVLEKLCESGQATIYRALHPSLLKEVVIKLAHSPWTGDESSRARLVTEAKVLAQIGHPNFARLYDLDFFENRPFLVLDYVRGPHLNQYRASVSLDPEAICLLVAKIARALAASHEQGFLHLDLKPENVLLNPDREPVLIDFGLSFLPTFKSSQIGERIVAGTPQYMAPEQLSGNRDTLTIRTDVFGLGGILFFLCTGQDPFPVTTVNGTLQRAADPDWSVLKRARVPARLESICRKALARDPAARYASAAQMANCLDKVCRCGPRRRMKRFRRLAWSLFLIGSICFCAGLMSSTPTVPQPASLTLHVERNGQDRLLPDALPLKVQDRIRVEAAIGESAYVSAFLFNATGQLQFLAPLHFQPEVNRMRIAFPSSQEYLAFNPNEGAFMVLLVSRRKNLITRSDASTLFNTGEVLQQTSTETVVTFDRTGVHFPGISATLTPRRAQLEAQLHSLRHELAARFDDYAGVLAVAEL